MAGAKFLGKKVQEYPPSWSPEVAMVQRGKSPPEKIVSHMLPTRYDLG
jgi:hypothetical protein